MSNGLDKLINDAACLRLEVAQLRGEVVALRHLVDGQNGELAALRIMLTAWPVQLPDNQPPVQH
jgi:hypothetical protein